MKKLLLLLTLFVSFNCIGQVYQNSKDTLGVMPIVKNISSGELYTSSMSVKPFSIQEYKPSFRIDSTYLQLIIQELERHGYTLVKLPKKQ